MIHFIKRFIDRTTMYRLVLYYLLLLLGVAVLAGAFGVLPYAPRDLLFSAVVLSAAGWLVNEALAWLLGVVTNDESWLITGLILALILPPVAFSNTAGALDLAVIAAWAVASKYFIAWGNKHIFNPAAFGVVLSSLLLGVPAVWWVSGNPYLLPFVILGGIAVVYKIRRTDLVLAFFAATFVSVALTSSTVYAGVHATILHSALFFLAFAMLTEPLTTPPTRTLRIVYGAIVGLLFAPALHIASFYWTPEIALLAGNVFSFVASPKKRHTLMLVGRKRLANGIYEFVFRPDVPLHHRAGQYLEWTLGHVPFDARGNRRYFTIASAPEESEVRLGVRFYDEPSGFKRALANLPPKGVLQVGSLSGDFVMPDNSKRKLAFLAGGIGVTPFASMARHMTLANDRRDAVLLYSSKTTAEVAYQDVFANAARAGLRTVYALSDEQPSLPGARFGMLSADVIREEIPDYTERLFYISGPPGMVDAMKASLRGLGVSRFSIKTDYFPGLA